MWRARAVSWYCTFSLGISHLNLGSTCAAQVAFKALQTILRTSTSHRYFWVQDATEGELERMNGTCAVCWGDMGPAVASQTPTGGKREQGEQFREPPEPQPAPGAQSPEDDGTGEKS